MLEVETTLIINTCPWNHKKLNHLPMVKNFLLRKRAHYVTIHTTQDSSTQLCVVQYTCCTKDWAHIVYGFVVVYGNEASVCASVFRRLVVKFYYYIFNYFASELQSFLILFLFFLHTKAATHTQTHP